MPCPILSCSVPVLEEGACCLSCPACRYRGILLPPEYKFVDPEQPCHLCLCQVSYLNVLKLIFFLSVRNIICCHFLTFLCPFSKLITLFYIVQYSQLMILIIGSLLLFRQLVNTIRTVTVATIVLWSYRMEM